jgi:hypothetical protein
MSQAPWASGPGEILQHGLSLLEEDNDTHRRLAMLSIDNAVELMIKTYLGLPKRVTGLAVSRNEYLEISESFPRLLDGLERYARDKLSGIHLGELEWYHRLRNELYHQGNGLTVERKKVTVYAELAKVLFSNLFGIELELKKTSESRQIGDFLTAWVELEKVIIALWDQTGISLHDRVNLLMTPRELADRGILDPRLADEITQLRKTRNNVVHGVEDPKFDLHLETVTRVNEIVAELKSKLSTSG